MVRWSWQQAGVGVAVAWVLLTLGHFLAGGAATATHPTPVPVGKEQVQEQVVEREEEEGQEEEGNYEAWWREQVERRVRVAETCAREGISQVASCSSFSSCSSSCSSSSSSSCSCSSESRAGYLPLRPRAQTALLQERQGETSLHSLPIKLLPGCASCPQTGQPGRSFNSTKLDFPPGGDHHLARSLPQFGRAAR